MLISLIIRIPSPSEASPLEGFSFCGSMCVMSMWRCLACGEHYPPVRSSQASSGSRDCDWDWMEHKDIESCERWERTSRIDHHRPQTVSMNCALCFFWSPPGPPLCRGWVHNRLTFYLNLRGASCPRDEAGQSPGRA